MTPTYLIVPGWGGSGPSHWQSHWQRALPTARRVEVPDWDRPARAAWVDAIDGAIDRVVDHAIDRAGRAAGAPVVVVAHSLGCVAVAHWAARARAPVAGALLVAPADVDQPGTPACLRGFAPVPTAPLPFPSIVVASTTDPYATLARASQLAFDWGSELTVLRDAGHINVDAGYGAWAEGRALLDRLAALPTRRRAEPRPAGAAVS